MRYSFPTLVAQALRGHTGWPRQWREPEPKARYDVIIVGAGGHGLATAYYLAREHGVQLITEIVASGEPLTAVIEEVEAPDEL